MQYLFSYGTLQQENVQISTFGRLLEGKKDSLSGYIIDDLVITDPKVISASGKSIHPILRYTGVSSDTVEGTVFQLTDTELAQSDAYEVADYQRQSAILQSGFRCWIYAAA